MKQAMEEGVLNKIIKYEKQLIAKKAPVEHLIELIDDDFTEMGSSGQVHDKVEVIRWLKRESQSERVGAQFKAKPLSEDVILVTYINFIKEPNDEESQQALRISIWRQVSDKWQMIFHQGTPIN